MFLEKSHLKTNADDKFSVTLRMEIVSDKAENFKTRLKLVTSDFSVYHISSQSFPKRKQLDSSKLKECADDNFRFDEKGRKSLRREGNTVGKGEIARYEQFLLFPRCFQKKCTADT